MRFPLLREAFPGGNTEDIRGYRWASKDSELSDPEGKVTHTSRPHSSLIQGSPVGGFLTVAGEKVLSRTPVPMKTCRIL